MNRKCLLLWVLCGSLALQAQPSQVVSEWQDTGREEVSREEFQQFLSDFPECREKEIRLPDPYVSPVYREAIFPIQTARLIPTLPKDTVVHRVREYRTFYRFSYPSHTVVLLIKRKEPRSAGLPAFKEDTYCFLSYSPEGRLIDYQEIATNAEAFPCRIHISCNPLVAEVRQAFVVSRTPDAQFIYVVEKRYALREDGTFTSSMGKEYRGLIQPQWRIYEEGVPLDDLYFQDIEEED